MTRQTPPTNVVLSEARIALLLVFVLLVSTGCTTRTSGHFKSAATAPAITGERRNVADPNAPFMLIDRTPHPIAQPVSGEDATASCDLSALSVSEISASMTDGFRSIRLAFVNRGETACRLGGFPSITLLDQDGQPVAGIAIEQTGEAAFAGSIADPTVATAVQTPAQVLLPPRGAASFQIGWAAGEYCRLISRFVVSAPGAASQSDAIMEKFAFDRPLTICSGQLRVTALSAGQA